MRSEHKHFYSGIMYRLGRLLDSDVKIIIPDLQRDYCWGTTMSDKGVSLASQFANDLLAQYRAKSKDLSIGLLYGYEVPFGHLQLCDGQQRITTLYLMLGLLNKKTRTLQDRLLSQREMDEFQEPYLQYAIRETTLYFMNDLVTSFFCDDSMKCVADIYNQSWYFDEYDNDPSIKSIMQSMIDIEKIINRLEGDELYRFAYFLCNDIKFIYYDMESRREGEKTFVIINTKGEPLSPTENLKPIFLEAYSNVQCVSKTWEEWETFFWKHRSEENGNDTADAGMREFFRWIMLIRYITKYDITGNQEDKKAYDKLRESGIYTFDTNIPYSDIQDYFRIVKRLFEGLYSQESVLLSPQEYDNNGTATTNQNAWFRLLPVVYYMHKFPNASDRKIQRIYQFFKHVSRLQNVGKAIKTLLPDAIRSIDKMTDDDILSISTLNATIFTNEEKHKLDLIRNFTGKREDLEDELWAAENFPVWQSTIMPLIGWAEHTGTFSFNDFKKYRLIIEELFGLNRDSDLDLFRRLLIAEGAPYYPCFIETFEPKSLTYKSFGYNNNQWREIIEKNSDAVRLLLDKIIAVAAPDVYTAMQDLLSGMSTGNIMVDEPGLLRACGKKLVLDGDEFNYKLVQQTRGKVAYRKSYKWCLFASQATLPNNWQCQGYYWDTEGGCTYFEKTDPIGSYCLAIDVQLKPNGVEIFLFARDGSKTTSLCGPQAARSGMTLKNDRYYYGLNINSTDSKILEFVKSLMF